MVKVAVCGGRRMSARYHGRGEIRKRTVRGVVEGSMELQSKRSVRSASEADQVGLTPGLPNVTSLKANLVKFGAVLRSKSATNPEAKGGGCGWC